MELNHKTVWTNCLKTIKANISSYSYKTWFDPIRSVKLTNKALTIRVPDKIFYDWLEEHYVSLLRMAIKSELGEGGKLHYQIIDKDKAQAAPKPVVKKVTNIQRDLTKSSKGNDAEVPTTKPPEIKNPFILPGIKKIRVDSNLNSKYRFTNYIQGDCNQLARSASLAISEKPGNTSFNPLYVYGNTGLGKTHLVQAIGNEVLEKYPEKLVLYVSTDKFTNQVIHAIRNNTVENFMNFYQMLDVLIIDDIQFLSGRSKTQDILFNVFNQLHQRRKQLIFTSDRRPQEMEGIQDRLISRFAWGLSADLGLPDLETRIAILQDKMEREGIIVSSQVAEFICYNVKNNIRELEGALINLIAHASFGKAELNMDLAKKVVKKFTVETKKEINVEFIQNTVADYYGIPIEQLVSKSRKRNIVTARQLSMYLSKKLTSQSLKDIGAHFGGKDHSTVIYSCTSVDNLISTNDAFKLSVEEIEKKIKMSVY